MPMKAGFRPTWRGEGFESAKVVIVGLVPIAHVLAAERKMWMARTRPAMTLQAGHIKRVKRDKTMPMDAKDIEAMIKAAIPDAEIDIRDLAGDGDHYAATVTSSAFSGLSRVRQHQMVYDALKGNMGGVLHALALTTVVKN
jgi:stress-induced morphogen